MFFRKIALFFSIVLGSIFLFSCNVEKWVAQQQKRTELKGIQYHTLETNGMQLAYWCGGNPAGKKVLLLHGFGGDAFLAWRKTFAYLKKDYLVIAPDLLWFGKSQALWQANLASQSKGINLLMEHLDWRPGTQGTIVGHSYGGFVASYLVYEHPNKFEKLMLINSPGQTYDVRELHTLCARYGKKQAEELFVVTDRYDLQRLLDFSSKHSIRLPKKIAIQVVKLYFSQHNEEKKQLLRSLFEQKDYLATIDIQYPQTMVLWGSEDQVFPLKEGKKLADFIGAQWVVFPNVGHSAQIEKEKRFKKTLLDFLK